MPPQWNGKMAGKPFGTKHNRGYIHGDIGGTKYLAHRIIWKMVTGEEPPEIDHDDGNGTNNRFANLLASNHQSNMRNAERRVPNTSGVVGVYPARGGRWTARIKTNGTFHTLGTFDTIEAAHAVRMARQRELGFTERHRLNLSGARL